MDTRRGRRRLQHRRRPCPRAAGRLLRVGTGSRCRLATVGASCGRRTRPSIRRATSQARRRSGFRSTRQSVKTRPQPLAGNRSVRFAGLRQASPATRRVLSRTCLALAPADRWHDPTASSMSEPYARKISSATERRVVPVQTSGAPADWGFDLPVTRLGRPCADRVADQLTGSPVRVRGGWTQQRRHRDPVGQPAHPAPAASPRRGGSLRATSHSDQPVPGWTVSATRAGTRPPRSASADP